MPSLDDFPRHSLTFGPSPIHPLPRLSAHLGGKVEIWAKREDCNSGIAFGGNKVRKLEYLSPRRWPRAATRWCRSAACSPTTPAPSPASPPTSGSRRSRCRSTGSSGPTSSTTGSATSSCRASWAAMCASIRPASTSASATQWQRALDSVVEAGGTPYAIPAGASDHPARRARLRQLGARGGRPGGRARPVLRPRHRVHRHRLDPRRDDRRLRAGGPRRPPPHRHRRLGDGRQDDGSRSPASPATPPRRSASIGSCAPTRSPSSTATTPASTASPTSRRSMRSAPAPGWRG